MRRAGFRTLARDVGAVAAVSAISLTIVLGARDGASSADIPDGAAAGDGSSPYDAPTIGSDDSGIDSSNSLDALPDVDRIPGFVTGWTKVPWAPQCELYSPPPLEVASASPPLTWQPCTSGRANCQELVLDWATATYMATYSVTGGVTSASATRLFMERAYSPYQVEYLVWDEGVGTVAVWRDNGSSNCIVVPPATLPGGSVALTEAIFSDAVHVSQYVQIVGQPADDMEKAAPDYSFAPADVGFADTLFMSHSSGNESVVTMEFDAVNGMAIRDRASNAIDYLTHMFVDPGQSIVESSVFFTSTAGAYVWTPGTGANLLIQRSTALVHDVESDGTTIVWIESANPDSNGQYQTTAIYGSPFTTVASAVAPTLLRSNACPSAWCITSLTSGNVVTRVNNPTVGGYSADLIVRVSDDSTWVVAPYVTASLLEDWDQPSGFASNGALWQTWANLKSASGHNKGIQRVSFISTDDGGDQ